MFVFFVDDARVVFFLFLLFFGCGFGVWSEEGDLLAVRRPRENVYGAFTFGDGFGFAAGNAHYINLFFVFARVRGPTREKCELFAVRGPARRFFGFLREGKLANAAGRLVVDPDVRGAAIVSGWLGDHEGQARAVRRQLQVGEEA